MNPPQEPAELAPYVIEGARSSRSRCKTCRRTIAKGALRIGIRIEGPYGVGYLWHHLNCAARRQFDRVEEAYAAEAWKEAKQPPDKVPSLEDLQRQREKAEEKRKSRREFPYAEEAPTGRAKCKQCEQPIEKGSLRVVMGRKVEFGNQVRTGPANVHPRCVAAELERDDTALETEGFIELLRSHCEDLKADRLEALIAEIGPVG